MKNNIDMTHCEWILYEEEDYYETECGQSAEKWDIDNISPDFCPWCGAKIKWE